MFGIDCMDGGDYVLLESPMLMYIKWIGTILVMIGSIGSFFNFFPWNFLGVGIGSVLLVIYYSLSKDNSQILNWGLNAFLMFGAVINFWYL